MAQDQAESGGVLRACAMTLVVVAEDAADADRGPPDRGRADAQSSQPRGDSASRRQTARFWTPGSSPNAGSRSARAQQICSEGIEITAGQSGFSEVAKFLVPLRVPDLPVVLWCRGTQLHLRAGTVWSRCFRWPTKSSSIPRKVADADSALQFLRRLRERGRRVADLHWTRLTGWREVLAHSVRRWRAAAGRGQQPRR